VLQATSEFLQKWKTLPRPAQHRKKKKKSWSAKSPGTFLKGGERKTSARVVETTKKQSRKRPKSRGEEKNYGRQDMKSPKKGGSNVLKTGKNRSPLD